jgi:hypothetical protein
MEMLDLMVAWLVDPFMQKWKARLEVFSTLAAKSDDDAFCTLVYRLFDKVFC